MHLEKYIPGLRAQSKTGVNSCLLRWHIKKDESESGKIIIWVSL